MTPLLRRLTFTGLIACITALPLSALAVQDSDFDYRTTKNLFNICSVSDDSPTPDPAVFACRAFIAATVQYHDAVSARGKMKRLICYPPGSTIADARRVFVDWGNRNQGNAELMGEPPVKGLVRALAEAAPCKPKK